MCYKQRKKSKHIKNPTKPLLSLYIQIYLQNHILLIKASIVYLRLILEEFRKMVKILIPQMNKSEIVNHFKIEGYAQTHHPDEHHPDSNYIS